jgi:thioredoxin family protein
MTSAARFAEGATIVSWLDRVAARAAEWRDGFESAAPGPLELGPEALAVAVLAEDWSWECAASLPASLRMLDGATGAAVRVFSRDESLDLACEIDRADPLAIPRVAIFDAAWTLVGSWGPRSAAAERVLREREALRPTSERILRLRAWYEADRGQSAAAELRALLVRAAAGATREVPR